VALRFLDILRPTRVIADRINAKPDDPAIALLELRHQPGHVAEFGRADRCEILWMGEQNRPAVADPLVQIDDALRRLGGEVRGFGVDPQRHNTSPRPLLRLL
jgi:hypothetical protein